MICTPPFDLSDWKEIELVAFDVDGTLYDQRLLRWRMARDMLLHVLKRRSLVVPTVIRNYRHLRERCGDEETHNFEPGLIASTAAATGLTEDQVRAIVAEWIEERPLPYLADCRYADVIELFAGLRRHGKVIGILSDYPAPAKLAAMGLAADFVVSAADENVGLLKPHPRGLEWLMQLAAVSPAATLLVGDRGERDGLAAQRAGTRCLIRSSGVMPGWQTFARFNDPLFAPMMTN